MIFAFAAKKKFVVLCVVDGGNGVCTATRFSFDHEAILNLPVEKISIHFAEGSYIIEKQQCLSRHRVK